MNALFKASILMSNIVYSYYSGAYPLRLALFYPSNHLKIVFYSQRVVAALYRLGGD